MIECECGNSFEPEVQHRHKLMCGDATAAADVTRLMNGEKADAVVTDPPYDISGGGRYGDPYSMDVGQAEKLHEFDKGFNPEEFINHIPLYCDTTANLFIFTSPYLAWRYYFPAFYEPYDVARLFVWCKPFALQNIRGVGFAKSYELAVYAWNKGHYFEALPGIDNYDVWRGTPNQGGKSHLHPTSKPLELILRIVRQLSPEAGNVADPFLGSGTTIVACEQTGRRGFGMEIEPKYVAVTLQRLADMGLEPRLAE